MKDTKSKGTAPKCTADNTSQHKRMAMGQKPNTGPGSAKSKPKV